jgi:hypothetical protein
VKLSNHPKASLEFELLARSSFSELLFPIAHSLPVYCSLNDEVNNMASAAYAVVGCNVNVRVEVKVLNKLAVVASRVITHKVV